MTDFVRPGYAVRLRRKMQLADQENYLIHYGIKGQKWGLRRFQNEDRTLTEAGKVRYSKEGTENRKAQKKAAKEEKKAARQAEKEAREAAKPESSTWKASEAKYLSDAELNRRNSRLQREAQYRQLTETKATKFINGFKRNMGKILIGSLVGAAAGYMGKNYKNMIETGANFIAGIADMPIDLGNLR